MNSVTPFQYIVTMDDFFLQYLAKGSMAVECHRAIGTEYQTIAVASVRSMRFMFC